ncbi:glutamine--fructose-6-phosphate transaminase (isomerizing) [Granulicatella seriolae]|uniref:Glutamine--fructose-6-phosphate aminotransferase [isomerizing] n=1 Tax=Granulicatella seriolae TaxID=2967226 RepID=A0ABT1WPP3_9LACT|nr:glutamine--fructose-6-phosphate transaminase (isomerizing) [Granulicatella seriolae]
MCGIVGCIGDRNIQDVIINGLEKLEYRGYDSAGVFILDEDGTRHLFKEVGRIEALKQAVDHSVPAHAGIGHTRWATHGPATRENAHPHQSPSGRFTLVHNGVIENFAELKEEYLSDVTFNSETDTEVAVDLIEYFAEKENLSGKEAFRKALTLIKGSFAFGLLDATQPDLMYAAKNKSPLLIGKGDGFNVIASDAMATIEQTDTYYEIKDQELITITKDDVTIETIDGTVIDRQPFVAELDKSDLGKGTYEHYMLKEIDEQPAVLRRIIQTYEDQSGNLTVDADLLESIKEADRIYVIACGTSYHAGWIGKDLFEGLAGIPTEVHLSSEFAYHQPLLTEKPFFIFLTQSGETADSRQALVKVNEKGYPSLTITNVKGSTLSREASFTMLLYAGPEIAVASSKAYTAQIAVMAVLADVLRQEKGKPATFDMKQELGLVAAAIEGVLSDKESIKELVDANLLETRNAFYIGRHLDYYVAMEAALKLKEISYVQTESFAAGELKHGTIALIEEGTPVLALLSEPVVASHTRGNIQEVRARGAKTITISMESSSREEDDIILQNVQMELAPLLMVVITQLIAYYTSLGKGLDVDKPRNLAKSVTVE